MRRRLSIRCASAFQSIETFFVFLTWFFAQMEKSMPIYGLSVEVSIEMLFLGKGEL